MVSKVNAFVSCQIAARDGRDFIFIYFFSFEDVARFVKSRYGFSLMVVGKAGEVPFENNPQIHADDAD